MVILRHSKVQLAVWQLTEQLNAWYNVVVILGGKNNGDPKPLQKKQKLKHI